MFEATPIEAIILEDVKQKTGLVFRRLGGIPTLEKAVADAVLPILTEWPSKLTDRDNYRGGVYHRFLTPHAYPFLDQIVSWWTSEQQEINLGLLTQTLALIVRCSDAERIWKLCGELPRRQFHYMLLSKLATCPEVGHEVKDALIVGLETEKLEAGNLSYIAQVNDPRIRRWFEGQVDSPDPNIRLVAKRVAAKSKKWPKGAEYAGQPPDRSEEIFSTEVGLEDLRHLFARLAKGIRPQSPRSDQDGPVSSFSGTQSMDPSSHLKCRWIFDRPLVPFRRHRYCRSGSHEARTGRIDRDSSPVTTTLPLLLHGKSCAPAGRFLRV